MLDSNSRKTRFIQQAIAHCGLKNAQVVQTRVQDYHAPDSPDFIVSRAYASLADFCESVAHLTEPQTRLLTMKTGLAADESGELDASKFAYEEEALQGVGLHRLEARAEEDRHVGVDDGLHARRQLQLRAQGADLLRDGEAGSPPG